MDKRVCAIILFLLFLGCFYLINKFLRKQSSGFNTITNSPSKLDYSIPQIEPKYKGLCLFDIDGTLTTGENNEEVIDMCLRSGYAVGISTAGAGYTPRNLLSFSWMPHNLYSFMQSNNFDTFNNVASDILMGKYNPLEYKFIRDRYNGHTVWGILKGHSLAKTAAKYNIKDPSKMILFDNDPGFLEGLKIYNKNLHFACAGAPCGSNLSLITVIEALHK